MTVKIGGGIALIKSIFILIISIVVGTILMIGVYLLPTGPMLKHMQESIRIYEAEGIEESWARGHGSAQIDNFTNSIMLRTAIYPGSGNVIKDAMLNPKYAYPKSNQVDSLIKQVKESPEKPVISIYPRYWHGYVLALKPLLSIMGVAEMRMINFLVQVLLAAYITMMLSIRLNKGVGLSYLLAYIALNPISLAMSFQHSSMYYIFSIFSIIVISCFDKIRECYNYVYLFLMAGILTAFFDFLTYPMISLGIPLAIFLLLLYKDNHLENVYDGIKKIFASGAFWGFGYAGMYLGKWLVGWKLTGFNVLQNALAQTAYRMSSETAKAEGGVHFNIFTVFNRNLRILMKDPVFILIAILIVYVIWKLYKNRAKINWHKYREIGISLAFVTLFPFAWYTALSNHSFVHSWFTYRELAISIFSLGSLLALLYYEVRGNHHE